MNKNALTKGKKVVVIIAAAALLIVGTVGATIAWLTDKTEDIVNTFTYGDINITLNETPETYKIVPGGTIHKDPKVTVEPGSESCYLFVTIEENNWPIFDGIRKADYEIDEAWERLNVEGNVYYRVVDADTPADEREFSVLKYDRVIVSDTLTKDEIDSVTAQPTLTFVAYAVQISGMDNPVQAWAQFDSSITEGASSATQQ